MLALLRLSNCWVFTQWTELASRKCSFPTEKGADLISVDFWPTWLFLLGLFLFPLISSIDNRKFFRMFVNIAGEGAGNSLIKNLQALSFCHIVLGCIRK